MLSVVIKVHNRLIRYINIQTITGLLVRAIPMSFVNRITLFATIPTVGILLTNSSLNRQAANKRAFKPYHSYKKFPITELKITLKTDRKNNSIISSLKRYRMIGGIIFNSKYVQY